MGLVVLAGNCGASVECKLVNNDEVGKAGESIPSPLAASIGTEGGEETSQDHDEIGNDGNQDVGTRETGQKSKIEQEKWGGNTPVNISCPVNLTEDDVLGVWLSVSVLVNLDDLVQGNAVTAGHGVVGEEGKCGDEGSQDVEKAFLLEKVLVGLQEARLSPF